MRRLATLAQPGRTVPPAGGSSPDLAGARDAATVGLLEPRLPLNEPEELGTPDDASRPAAPDTPDDSGPPATPDTPEDSGPLTTPDTRDDSGPPTTPDPPEDSGPPATPDPRDDSCPPTTRDVPDDFRRPARRGSRRAAVGSALFRAGVGLTVSAVLAFAVLAAFRTDGGPAGTGSATGADRAATVQGNSAASPAAAASPYQGAPGTSAAGGLGPAPTQLVVPDLVAELPSGFTAAQLAEIGTLSGVRAVMPVDGGQVTIDGIAATVMGVSPQEFRSWVPPTTAADADLWTALISGDLVASRDGQLALTPGTAAELGGTAGVPVIVAATADLGLPGVDAVMDVQRADQLGLAANVAVLINAPGADLTALMQQVQSVTGAAGHVVNLVPVTTTFKLPVTTTVPAGMPTNYLELYEDSAAQYCPGLSWTVLAAIGQIESGEGANDGPSSAGALGPMQFLPSTWAEWGIDAFGQTGAPDINNPLDAVPSAARMLCADGAAAGGASLEGAIYDYNHADWYVNEVLSLAQEYAQEYA
jgi:hypothetical protein